jgi:plasmid maintenance system antidote protein VapI
MVKIGIRSLRELARQSATCHPTISNWLNGKSKLSRDVGIRVARVLGVPLEVVFGVQGQMVNEVEPSEAGR